MTLRHLWQRLTGREAATLRHQRDAADEQAGIERQRRMAAERRYRAAASLGAKAARALRASKEERDALRRDLRRAEESTTLFQGEAYHANANAEIVADALKAARLETANALRAASAWERDYEAALACLEHARRNTVRLDEMSQIFRWLRSFASGGNGSERHRAEAAEWLRATAPTLDEDTLPSAGEDR